MTVNVNNGFQAHVAFDFGWSGTVGVVDLGDRWQIAYPSALAPPVGHEMTLGDKLLAVTHVTVDRDRPMTTLTLKQKGYELR